MMKVVHYVQLFLIMLAPAAVNFGTCSRLASIAARRGCRDALAAALVPFRRPSTPHAVTPIAHR